MRRGALLLACLVACGDNVAPPLDAPIDAPIDAPHTFTWGDAEAVYADGWCAYAERCFPAEFASHFGDHAGCVLAIAAQNCASALRVNPCTDAYPTDRDRELTTCHDELAGIECTATSAPAACYSAFAPVYP